MQETYLSDEERVVDFRSGVGKLEHVARAARSSWKVVATHAEPG